MNCAIILFVCVVACQVLFVHGQGRDACTAPVEVASAHQERRSLLQVSTKHREEPDPFPTMEPKNTTNSSDGENWGHDGEAETSELACQGKPDGESCMFKFDNSQAVTGVCEPSDGGSESTCRLSGKDWGHEGVALPWEVACFGMKDGEGCEFTRQPSGKAAGTCGPSKGGSEFTCFISGKNWGHSGAATPWEVVCEGKKEGETCKFTERPSADHDGRCGPRISGSESTCLISGKGWGHRGSALPWEMACMGKKDEATCHFTSERASGKVDGRCGPSLGGSEFTCLTSGEKWGHEGLAWPWEVACIGKDYEVPCHFSGRAAETVDGKCGLPSRRTIHEEDEEGERTSKKSSQPTCIVGGKPWGHAGDAEPGEVACLGKKNGDGCKFTQRELPGEHDGRCGPSKGGSEPTCFLDAE